MEQNEMDMTPILSTKEVLNQVKGIFKAPEHWAQGAGCKDDGGWFISDYHSPQAFSYCLAGAMEKVMGLGMDGPTISNELPLRPAVNALGFSNLTELVNWNDKSYRTFEDVIARLDEAIAIQEKVEKALFLS
jgi:hypothetical protein